MRAAPAFTVEIPELDAAAIERLAEAMLPLLEQFEHDAADERTPGGEVPPGNPVTKGTNDECDSEN